MRLKLLEQHDCLRALMAAAEALAARLAGGEAVGGELDRALDALRAEFFAHNRFEEAALRPVLAPDDVWGRLRVERMNEEHVAEHAAFEALLAGSAESVVPRLPDFAEQLMAHMAAEERTFLSPQVLRGEPVEPNAAPPVTRSGR